MIEAPLKLLLIYMDDADMWQDLPLHEGLLRRFRQLKISGATVTKGAMGLGSHHKVHHKGLFGMSEEHPIVISVVENEILLRAALPEVRLMAPKALMVLVDVEVVP